MNSFIRSLVISAGIFASASTYAGASRIGNAYYEDIFPQTTCGGGNLCFESATSATPSDTFLRMQHVYCSIVTAGSAPLQTMSIVITTGPAGGGTVIKQVPIGFPPPVSSAAGQNVYNLDHDILLATGPSRYISIVVVTTQTATSIVMNCAISGDLIPPP